MKKYLLLRNNRQSGPHSLDEFRADGLRALDLIWIENSSTSWQHPAEFDELKAFIKEEVRPAWSERKPATAKPAVISVPKDDTVVQKHSDFIEDYASFAPDDSIIAKHSDTIPPFEEKEPEPLAQKRVWKRKFSLPVNSVTNVAAVFFSAVIGAVLIKKAVDGSAMRPEESVATTIITEEPVDNSNIRTALTTEFVPVATEKPLPKPKLKDIKKQVQLKASPYKVGLLGGISNLSLTVVNTSPHFVDKVSVEVSYLKKNGDVIETEFFDVSSVKPHSSKILPVPEKNRGMKVRYRIIGLSSQQYKAALKNV